MNKTKTHLKNLSNMQNKTLQRKRALRTALLVLLLSVAGTTKGYAGIIDTIGNIVYQFAGPSPASPYPYPYNAAIVIGHKFGTDATGSLVIPESVHFMGNENLALVPVARIEAGAFAGCSGLTSIAFPNSLEEILHGAFYGCSGLTGNLEIPSSVLSIGATYYSEWGYVDPWEYGGAFEGCNFTGVTIMATTPPILSNEWSYIDPFNNVPCSNLTVPCECIPAYEASEWHYHFTTIVEDCTGFPENGEDFITVFPNPTNGQVRIEGENLRHIIIYNAIGQQVYNRETSNDVFEYDFHNHKEGLYLIRIETESGVAVKKVLVER